MVDSGWIDTPQLLQLIGGLFTTYYIDELRASLLCQCYQLLPQHAVAMQTRSTRKLGSVWHPV